MELYPFDNVTKNIYTKKDVEKKTKKQNGMISNSIGVFLVLLSMSVQHLKAVQ